MSLYGENWGADPLRAPKLEEGETVMFSEHGRIVKANTYGHGRNGIDYRSHYFTIVKTAYSGCALLVKHGGGEERFKLDYSAPRVAQFFEPLDSTARYLLMHAFYSVHEDAARDAKAATAQEHKLAFAEGRLKKRKQRGADAVKVWIEARA